MLIVVLGSSNDANGKLLPFAVSRCQKALSIYQQYHSKHDCKIICTGGFGEHFNVTQVAHALYLQDYLISLGIPSLNFLAIVESGFTVEDATLLAQHFADFPDDEIIVISSDFHMERVAFIFSRLYPTRQFTFVGSDSEISEAERERLVEHEKFALAREKSRFNNC